MLEASFQDVRTAPLVGCMPRRALRGVMVATGLVHVDLVNKNGASDRRALVLFGSRPTRALRRVGQLWATSLPNGMQAMWCLRLAGGRQ